MRQKGVCLDFLLACAFRFLKAEISVTCPRSKDILGLRKNLEERDGVSGMVPVLDVMAAVAIKSHDMENREKSSSWIEKCGNL